MPNSAFRDWINKLGPSKVSKILKVTDVTVRQWRLGYSLPRPAQMKRIKELTKGRVGYIEIIEGSCSPLTKRGA